MKLIKQSFEILEQEDFSLVGIKKFIERCARVSYKSEDRMTDTSYEKFVGMLVNRNHSRPLEFGTVHLKMPVGVFESLSGFCISKDMWNSGWIKYNIEVGNPHEDSNVYITTNYRYYNILRSIKPLYGYIDVKEFFNEEDNPLYPKRYTVHMILSRGVMDEFRTHVGLSHLAESTRYVNYSKDRFGNEVTFIIPNWIDIEPQEIKTDSFGFPLHIKNDKYADFLYGLGSSEVTYLRLLKSGWKPQQARTVLPLDIKSELISCGFADAWANFFYRRCAPDAHPMAREIAIPIQEKFKELCYIGYVSK